jgi:hypothetical protein
MIAENENRPCVNEAKLTDRSDFTPPFPPLERVTKPTLTTHEIAYYLNQAPQTWRIHACRETYPVGLRPIRIGNRLNWPTAGLKKLIGFDKASDEVTV